MMSNEEEKRVLKGIAEGNESSFRELFDCYKNIVFNYLISVVKSKEIAEELTMDIFMKLWLGKDFITEIMNIPAFLKKVAYNRAIDFIRVASKNKRLQNFVELEMIEIADNSFERQMLENEYHYILKQAVQRLSPQRKIVYVLSREQGLTHDEIAERLGLSINTVNNHIKEALKNIKSFLYKQNIPPFIILLIMLK